MYTDNNNNIKLAIRIYRFNCIHVVKDARNDGERIYNIITKSRHRKKIFS